MRDLLTTLLLISALPTGCGTDIEVLEENIEHQIRWQQAPGEIQDCHVFKLTNTREVEVDRLQVKFPEGSHHVHIYRSNEPEADKVFDCFKGINWQHWSLLLGAQTQAMDWKLPEGVTIKLEPHQQLLAQVHWLNTTDKAMDEKIDISFHTTEVSEEHLGTVFGVNKRIDIAPGQRSRVEQFCPVPAGAKLHAVMGHFHQHGYDFQMKEQMPDQTAGQMLYAAPDEPSFEFKTYNPAHPVARGAGFQFGCSFFNWSSAPLTWGSDTQTQEHCNMTAYFSPAEKVSEFCLLEPSKLSALTTSAPEVRVGQDLLLDIELASPETTEVVVELTSSDAAALEVPSQIIIPAGARHASFTARTLRPGNVEVAAALSGARIITPVRVTGLVVSEVFYNSATGANDNLQWVEIANQSNVAIDLSGYSVGAGTTDFMRTRLALPMTIPARGCIVVGGTESSPANYTPYLDLSEDFSPDLSLGLDQAAGIGIFATASMSSTARPIDSIVYGGPNASLRGPDGQIAPVWPGSTPGGSLRRVTPSIWAKSSVPTPGICEVLDAH
jgi:hypothetical protein